MLTTLKSAYGEFEQKLAEVASAPGAKSALVRAAIGAKTGPFTLAALEHECPGVSRDLIRRVLGELRKENAIEAIGKGPGARWRKKA